MPAVGALVGNQPLFVRRRSNGKDLSHLGLALRAAREIVRT